MRYAKSGKFTTILPKIVFETSNAMENHRDQSKEKHNKSKERLSPMHTKKPEVEPQLTNKGENVEYEPASLYSPTSTQLTWCLDLYIKELLDMKERLQSLETRGHFEDIKIKEITKVNWKLTKENKSLREKVHYLQSNMEKGEQELISIKQTLEKIIIAKESKAKVKEGSSDSQIKEIQSGKHGNKRKPIKRTNQRGQILDSSGERNIKSTK